MRQNQDPTTQRPTILLVDDEEFLRRLLARVLDGTGFDVIEAENGAAALRAAADLDGALRLVVTDVHMPVMNGIEFAHEFRPRYPAVPVLFITGRDAGITDDPAFLDGHLLRKPFRSEAFLAAVARLLGNGSESLGRSHSVA
jgi:two-component system, cell cycle sensor histidine kinase and response regulator CckA